MSSIDGWLATKYAILAKQAESADIDARARAGLLDAQAANVGFDSATRRIGANAEAGLANANAGLATANAAQVPAIAGAKIGLEGAQAGLYGAQTGLVSTQNDMQRDILNAPEGLGGYLLGQDAGYRPQSQRLGQPRLSTTGGISTVPGATTRIGSSIIGTQPAPTATTAVQRAQVGAGIDALNDGSLPGIGQKPKKYAKGTAKVPGKGDGTKDTVKAVLAPGEAVLNKGAAEHLGRPVIEALNTIGALKMGMGADAPATAPAGAQGFARGTSKVTKKAPKKAAAKTAGPMLDPKMLMALMSMGGQAGMA